MRTSVLPSPPLRFTSSRSLLVILLSLPRPSLQRTHHVQESQCLLLLSVFKQILFLPPADSPQRLHSWNFSFSVCPVWRWCQEAFPCWACSAFLRERVCFRLRGCAPLHLPQDMWTPLPGRPALSAAVEKPKPVRFFPLVECLAWSTCGEGGEEFPEFQKLNQGNASEWRVFGIKCPWNKMCSFLLSEEFFGLRLTLLLCHSWLSSRGDSRHPRVGAACLLYPLASS